MGSKNAFKPTAAPSRVTARITTIKKMTTNVGMNILLATSIPFLTPAKRINNAIAQTSSKGIATPGTNPPASPGTSPSSKTVPNKKPAVSSPHA